MAEDCIEAYKRFFIEFVNKVDPYDQLPVTVSSYSVTDAEIVGETINVTLQYFNQMQCPPNLQAHLIHQVIQEIKSMCKKQPEDCGYKAKEKIYTSLKLMQAITGEVNKICYRFLLKTHLPLLIPTPSTPLPQVVAGGNKNCRRKMEDRYVVLHDLHATFGIEDDSVANYYAVFDGHAGQDAAVYCASHLHQYLAESRHYPTDPERALYDAFITTDTQFIEKSKTQKVCGGTTAVCTLLLNKKLYVAWVGDSTAMLVNSNTVVQLVNPHRLNREDEVQRIQRVGGVVMESVGILRVNGVLSISRAIGDVRYKPFVTGEPEVKCYPLDGTEDFLVIATDGLTDYVEPTEIATVLYHEMQRSPNGLNRAHHILLQWAKHAGSKDNITLVVVLLSPAREITARSRKIRLYNPFYSVRVHDILEKMNSKDKPLFLDIDDAHNAINSNILKQTMLSQESRDHGDDGILAASNGKHENGDADYDYSDLGPETDVDAIDDVPTMPVKNLSYEFYKDDDSNSDEDRLDKDSNVLDNVAINAPEINPKYQPDAENNLHEDEDDDDDEEDEDDDENDKVLDDFGEPQVVQKITPELIQDNFAALRDAVREQIEESVDDEEMPMKNDDDRADHQAQDHVNESGSVDFDDSPPSPEANKPLQHALIPEADNVADSEDSEDEWNYYRVDPNKEKESTTPEDEPQQAKQEEEIESLEAPIEDNDLKIYSEDLGIGDKVIPKEELSELFNAELRTADSKEEQQEESFTEDKDKLKDMDFQLNPDAAEFVPVSPQFAGTRINLMEDYPISGSPLKQVQQMDDIQVPSQSEFEEEVCQRPREVESEGKDYQNGLNQNSNDDADFITDQQKLISFSANMDDSEVSSTKAEFGDVSSTSFLTTTEFHRTGASTVDESFSSYEREYDIAKDPMAMSFTPSDFEAAFDRGNNFDGEFDKAVDLNAVHNLSNTDLDDKNGSMEESELTAQSPELHPEQTNLASSETEQPSHTQTFANEPPEMRDFLSRLNNVSIVEHECRGQTPLDFLNAHAKSSKAEAEYSTLAEDFCAEFESDEEEASVDNKPPLSPANVNIEETKILDSTSEDALLPEHELQKETCENKEGDTPSSLSPVPDAMESNLVAPTETDKIPSAPPESTLQDETLVFTPGHYDFQAYSAESGSVNQPQTTESTEVCQSTVSEPRDICESPVMKSDDIRSASSTEAIDICPSSVTMPQQEADVLEPSATEQCDTTEISPVEAKDVRGTSPLSPMDVCQSPIEKSGNIFLASSTEAMDICICPVPSSQEVADVFELSATPAYDLRASSPLAQTSDVYELSPSKSNDVCELSLENENDSSRVQAAVDMEECEPIVQNLDAQPAEEEKRVESPQPTQENLLDFVEEQEVCALKEEEAEPTPPPSPQSVEEKVPQVIHDLICRMKSVFPHETEQAPEVKEETVVVESEISETKPQDIDELAKEPALCLSESMQEFTGLECQLQPKSDDVPVISAVPEVQENVPETKEEVTEVQKEVAEVQKEIAEVQKEVAEIQEEVVEFQKEVPEVQKEVPKEEEVTEVKEILEPEKALEPAVEEVCKLEQVEKIEAVSLETQEPVIEKIPETTPETKISEMATVTAAAAAIAASAAGAVAVTQSKAKVKAAAAKPPSKTATSKTAQKSNPTSPSKSVTSTARSLAGLAKKPATTATTRPKDLDAPKKIMLSCTASTKATATKTAPKTTATTRTVTKLGTSATAKPKPATTASKPAPSEKKPTANGDVKPLSKLTVASKTSTVTKTAATTRPATAKPSTTKASTLTTTTKTRPSSATTAAKPSPAKPSAATTTTTTASTRSKSTPTATNATKPRLSLSKPPIIDKQVKETANKQISMARTTTKTTTRQVASSTTTTTGTKRMSSTTKTTTAASPVKKVTAVSKTTSKVLIGGKTTTEKAKVVQNGVSEKIEMNAIIDDVPKKDLSPVVTPNDNQLIMSSD